MSISVPPISSGVSDAVATPKTLVSEQPSREVPDLRSAIVSISAESTEDEDAKALADFVASGPGVTLRMLDAQTQMDNYDKEYAAFTVKPKEEANNALRRTSAELVRLQDRIESSRPSMLGKKWDFVLQTDKIEVVNDNLSKNDRQWLQNVLNKNNKLVASVTSFYDAVTKYYDNTRDHAAPTMRDSTGYHTGYVTDAAGQINGKLAVRDVMDKTIASLSRPNALFSSYKETPFLNAVEFAASTFKFEKEPKFQVARYDMSDAVTAQYFKDHSNEPH